MKHSLKTLSLVVIFMAASFCSSTKAVAKQKNLIDFSEQNFGVRFSHTPHLATTYNPPGGADRVVLTYEGRPLGGLLIRPVPRSLSVKEFIEAGKAYYREKWGVTNVAYESFTNPNKYKFHHLKIEVKQNGEAYVLERFIYLRAETIVPKDRSKKAIRLISGAYSFEFGYLKAEVKPLKPEIKTVIDTFKLDPVPGMTGPAK
jgi:hypothetical protein